VTPAYPGKIKCSPPIPYEVCLKILNGQIDEAGLEKLGQAIIHGDRFSAADKSRLFNGLINGNLYTSGNVDNIIGYNRKCDHLILNNLRYGHLVGFGSYDDSNKNNLKQLSSTINNFGTTYGTYGNNLATSNNIGLIKESSGNYKYETADFGDDPGKYIFKNIYLQTKY